MTFICNIYSCNAISKKLKYNKYIIAVSRNDLFKFLSEVELNKQSQKMIAPLLSLLETCESYEEAYELLTDKNLHTKQLEQSIQKAMFLCELQGRSDGLDE